MKTTAALLAATLSLVGCVSNPAPTPTAVNRPVVTQSYVRLAPGATNEARAWSGDEVVNQLSDMTYLRNIPGQRNEVYYFSPDRIAYLWTSGGKFVHSATWIADMRTPHGDSKPALYVCMAFPRVDSSGNAVVGTPLTLCLDPAVLYTPAVDRMRGDAFGIRGRKQPPFTLPIERTTITALKR